MNATQEAGPWTQPYWQTGGAWRENYNPAPQLRDPRFPPLAPRENSLAWEFAGLAALALVVVGGIYLWPDVARYMKIRNM